jgi:hypothetical protein
MERKFTLNDYITYLTKNTDVRIRKGNYSKASITADLKLMFGGVGE